jgi:hypothetical protein
MFLDFDDTNISMWIGKGETPAASRNKVAVKAPARPAAPARELHVAHIIEVLVGDFLIHHGRLEKRSAGRHLLHFIGANHHSDGSTEYTVRTRLHTSNGMERNFESRVRVSSNGALALIR